MRNRSVGARMTAWVCLLALAACSRGSGGPATVVTDSAGVTIVTSDPERPAWNRETAWRLAPSPAIQVGNVVGDPGHQLYGVEHARRLQDGSLVVANTGLGDVRVFDAGGTPVRTNPLPPGAWQEPPVQPTFVHGLPGDSTLVAFRDGGVAILRPDGFMGRRVPPAPAQGDGVMKLIPTGLFGDGALLMRGDLPYDTVQPGIRRHPVRLFRWDVARGGRPAPIGDVGAKAELVGEGVLVWAPEGQWFAADSTVWYADTEQYEVREIAPGGRTLRVFRLDQEPARVMQADTMTFRRGAFTQIEANSNADSAQKVVDEYRYPANFPAIDRLVVDQLGNVWVRHFGWFDLGGDKTWSVFAPDGRYLGDVSTPSLLEIYQIGPDWLLGRMATTRGREAVYLWDILKPGEAAANSAAAPPGS